MSEEQKEKSPNAPETGYFKSISRIGLIFFLGLSLFFISGFVVITVLVSTKSKVRVPDLIGHVYLDEHNGLAESGFRVRLERVFSEEYPQGYILSQTPSAGQIVGTGRRLNLVINQSENIVPVPKLIGVGEQLVDSMLKNIPKGGRVYALNKGVITRVPSEAPKGEILMQDPPAEARVIPGTPVALLISNGPANEKLKAAYKPELPDNVPVAIVQRMAYELKTPVQVATVNVEEYAKNGVVISSNYSPGEKAEWKIEVGRFDLGLKEISADELPYHIIFRNAQKDGVKSGSVTMAVKKTTSEGVRYEHPMYFASLSDLYPVYLNTEDELVVWDGWQTLEEKATTTANVPEGAVKLVEDEKPVEFKIPSPKSSFTLRSL